jgi:uncharacterized protein with PQ loop repeat
VPDGVSALSAINGVTACCAWIAYGLMIGVVPVWFVSVLALIPSVWTAWLLRREMTWSVLGLAGAWVATLFLAAALGVFGAILGVCVVVTQGPQVVRALREHDLSGISSTTWRIAIFDGLAYGLYGIALGDAALLGYCVVLVTCAGIVLFRLWQTSPDPVPAYAS